MMPPSPSRLERLAAVLEALGPAERRDAYLSIAREALDQGQGGACAVCRRRRSAPGRGVRRRTGGGRSSTRPPPSLPAADFDGGMARCEALDEAQLAEEDAELLEAARAVAAEVAPPTPSARRSQAGRGHGRRLQSRRDGPQRDCARRRAHRDSEQMTMSHVAARTTVLPPTTPLPAVRDAAVKAGRTRWAMPTSASTSPVSRPAVSAADESRRSERGPRAAGCPLAAAERAAAGSRSPTRAPAARPAARPYPERSGDKPSRDAGRASTLVHTSGLAATSAAPPADLPPPLPRWPVMPPAVMSIGRRDRAAALPVGIRRPAAAEHGAHGPIASRPFRVGSRQPRPQAPERGWRRCPALDPQGSRQMTGPASRRRRRAPDVFVVARETHLPPVDAAASHRRRGRRRAAGGTPPRWRRQAASRAAETAPGRERRHSAPVAQSRRSEDARPAAGAATPAGFSADAASPQAQPQAQTGSSPNANGNPIQGRRRSGAARPLAGSSATARRHRAARDRSWTALPRRSRLPSDTSPAGPARRPPSTSLSRSKSSPSSSTPPSSAPSPCASRSGTTRSSCRWRPAAATPPAWSMPTARRSRACCARPATTSRP